MTTYSNNSTEYRRFPFWGILLSGIFLLLIIRIYWDPSLSTSTSSTTLSSAYKDTWTKGQYIIWGPIWKYGFERIKKGEIPFWNPYQLCGQPYLVDFRTALFQPLHMLFWRIDFQTAYQWYIFLCLFLLGLGFLIWGRILEIPYPALLPGLVSLLFSSPTIAVQMSISFLSGSVWLVFLMGGVVYFLENSTGRSFLVLLFIWVALLLSGSIECITSGFILLLLFPLILEKLPMLSVSRTISSAFRNIAFVLILGLMITAFSWLPSVVWLVQTRGDLTTFQGFPIAIHFPTSLSEMLSSFYSTLTKPSISTLSLIYPGVICLVFLPSAFFDRELRRIVIFLGSLLLFFILLFFVNLELAHLLQRGMIIIIAVALSTLSGIGINRLLLKGRDVKSPYIWVSGIIVFSLTVFIIIVSSPWVKGISVILCLIIVPAMLIRIRKINNLLSILLALLCFLELFYMFRPFLPSSYTAEIKKYEEYAEFNKTLRYQTGTSRAYITSEPSSILWSENLGMYYHWQMLNGKDIPMDKRSQKWFEEASVISTDKNIPLTQRLNNPLIMLSGVQWAFVSMNENPPNDTDLKNWKKLERLPFINVYENMQSLPRCFWVEKYKITTSLDETIQILSAPEFSPLRECVLETEPAKDAILTIDKTEKELTSVEQTAEQKAECTILDETPEQISISVKAFNDGVLILLDTLTYGWHATVDNIPSKIIQANGIFRGVYINKGTHQVVFEYKVPAWNEGRIISIIGVIVSFIFTFMYLFFNKKREQPIY